MQKNNHKDIFRERCLQCFRPPSTCFCHILKPFSTNFEFCILMHPKEAKITHMGTGRMTNVALRNCRIIVGENFDDNHQVQKIIHSEKYFPMMLYPGNNAINVSSDKLSTDLFQGKKPLVFILDGTWPCAKSMMRDSKTLHSLLRISFDSRLESKFAIRQQPAKYCLSTIESVYQVLSALELQGLECLGEKKEVLPLALESLVDFQIKCSQNPNLESRKGRTKAYKDPSQRKVSKKHLVRKICFEDKNYEK